MAALNDDRADEQEFGLAVAHMAVDFACKLLDHLWLECLDGPTPPIINLTMAQVAVKNLLAAVRGHTEAWQRAACHDGDEAAEYDATHDDSEAVVPMPDLVIDHPQQGQIEIARWCDLGIGIGVGKYYAFTPCPENGERVRLKDATMLPLVGERWRKVLECLALSRDGKTATKAELVMTLGYLKKGEVREDCTATNNSRLPTLP